MSSPTLSLYYSRQVIFPLCSSASAKRVTFQGRGEGWLSWYGKCSGQCLAHTGCSSLVCSGGWREPRWERVGVWGWRLGPGSLPCLVGFFFLLTQDPIKWYKLGSNHVSFRLLWPWQSLRLPFLFDDLDVFENYSGIVWNVSLVELGFRKEDHSDEVTFSMHQGFILSTGISLINSLRHPPKVYFLGLSLWSSIFTSSLSTL